MNHVADPISFIESKFGITLRRAHHDEYVGPCPMDCHGAGIDRFHLFLDGSPRVWCRVCDYKAFVDQLADSDYRIDPEAIAQYRQQREQEQEKRDQYRRAKLAQFSTKEIWREYCERMADCHKQWWKKNGVPEDWQKYLRLGHIDQKPFKDDHDNLLTAPAYTIPYFHYTEQHPIFITMQYRLDTDQTDQRYRFETGLGSSWYSTTPTRSILDKVVICEGAKKGIVTRIHLADDSFSVLAVPSKSDWAGIIEQVSECGLVYIVLDPDATRQAREMKNQIGDAARVIELPEKIDDAVLQHGLNRSAWGNITRYSLSL
jgi:hypothetical protein